MTRTPSKRLGDLGRAESGLRRFHVRGLLAVSRVRLWSAALRSGSYIQETFGLGWDAPTPTNEEVPGEKLKRSALGVLCEVSTLCRLEAVPTSAIGSLVQNAYEMDGLPTTAYVAHRPEYTYEKSRFFPAASVRAWLIATNRLEEYAEKEALQKELIEVLALYSRAGYGTDLGELANSLDRAILPVML